MGLREGPFGWLFYWAGRSIPLKDLARQPDLRVLDNQLTETSLIKLSQQQLELTDDGLIYQLPGLKIKALKLPTWPVELEVDFWFLTISSVAWLQAKGLLPDLQKQLTLSYDWSFHNC